MRNNLLIVLLSVFLFSCNRKAEYLNKAEYEAYIKNAGNGYLKTVEFTDLSYQIQFKNATLIALNEQLRFQFNDDSLKMRIKSLDSSIWVHVKIKTVGSGINPLKANVSGLEEYNERLNYFLRDAASNFTLFQGDKELKQIAYQFENSYGVSPFENIILGFKLKTTVINENLHFKYNDQLFNHGLIQTSLDYRDIKLTPLLKL